MSPREAVQTDPAQRLLLLTTYEALEMAGYTPNGSPSYAGDRIGTFFGQTLDDYREANAGQDIEMYYVTGGIRAFGPGRLNYHFKWEGPSYCVDAACSSSALAIQMGVKALRSHECDTAVAGGTNILTGSDMYSGLSRGSFLSPTGSCKTFDNDADGYCRGEGAGTVILKRLDDALAEGDNIQAIIKSAATNHSAFANSITHPHAGAQQSLMRQVLCEANLDADDIDYVEMHGTGTQAGDATEFTSVTNVLAGRSKDNPLHVGAVKANVGHAEAAAGINSLTKILMMMRKDAIPPHVGIKGRINEKFPPLDKVNVCIDRTLTPFKARNGGDEKRRVLLNNFNATGGNTSLVIEDGLKTTPEGVDPRNMHVVALSAKTAHSLKQNTQRLLDYIESHPETPLQDLAYTTTARRMHHVFRSAYAVENLDQLAQSMKKDLATSPAPRPTTETTSAIFAFTGQGAQYMGMGRRLFETSTAFRKNILDYDSICIQQGLPSFKDMLMSDSLDKMSPSQSQLALVSIAIALASLWKSWGIKPAAVIGHSLGEYVALCTANVLSVSDTLYLVGKRAETMEQKCSAGSHAMVAVQSTAKLVQEIIDGSDVRSCAIACFNGPANTVVSGEHTEIGSLQNMFDVRGIKTTLLALPFAFHSAQMDPILDDIRSIARNVDFREPSVPVASTLLGLLVQTKGVITPDYLARQARQPVRFQGALEMLRNQGIASDESLWLELGAHPLCLGMVRSTLGLSPAKTLASLKRDENCWSTISKSIRDAYNSGTNISWADYHNEYRQSLRLLDLPTYAFDLKNYWLSYKGDWLLTKGDTRKTAAAAPQSSFHTTCLQHVDSEIITHNSASVAFSSQLSNAKLNAAVRGHRVNGTGLCPSSVYADVAFTAAWYIASRMAPSEPVPAMDLSMMEVFRPLIVDTGETAQVLKVSASRQPSERSVKVTISSRDAKVSQDHASCTVQYGNGQGWMQEWQKSSYLVQSRMDQLIQPSKPANVHRLLKNMIYKQFETVVKYDKPYHNIDELFMDCDLNESVANIRFQPTAEQGDFIYSPYWIDTVAHLGGFVLNASVNTPADTVFISHGWESFRIAAPLSAEKAYKGYVRMQPIGSRGVLAGDMYIFDGDDVVVLCRGLKFQQMKRNVLHSLLSKNQGAVPTQRPNAAAAAKQFPQRPKISPKAVVIPPVSTSDFSSVLATIANEVGADAAELTDDAKVTDHGVDSLLTITILGKLRAETGLDLPSSLFVTYPTIGELKGFFSNKMTVPQSPVDDDDGDASSYSTSAQVSVASTVPSTVPCSAPSTPPEAEAPDVVSTLLSILAKEVGIESSEILPSTPFSEIGVDSLLTISILDALKTQIGLNLPANFFQDNPTIGDVQRTLRIPKVTHMSAPSSSNIPSREPEPPRQKYRSKSVLLQGRPIPGRPALFLLPDGAGSLFSYINLPSLHSDLPVYGLDSPFHDNAADYTISFEEVAAIYIQEIQTLQPQGPYMLGGWSLGGIHAYETARQLIQQGETITSLIMIDSPCPGTLPPLPSPTLGLLEKAGIFDGLSATSRPVSDRTRQHFVACVQALEHYTVTPLPAGKGPGKVTVIWARDGLVEGNIDEVFGKPSETDDDKAKDMMVAKEWLSGKRKSFGPSGWDKLTGTEVECHVVGGNHFSIMFPPKVCDPYD
jgi:iterative type I PKS product template protein